MDFNALQHKLFELDPSDPKEDLRKLAEAAGSDSQKSATSDVNYVQESVEVQEGSLEMDRDYSVADFATLAGVTLNESQKTGSAGQAKGKDTMPKAEPGRTKHPLKDKLVGEDNVMSKVKQGFKTYNNMSGVKPDFNKKKSPEKVKGSVAPMQLNRLLNVSDSSAFTQAILKSKQGQALSLPQTKALAEAFQKLMAMDPQETQRVMMMLKRMEGEASNESSEADNIKARLWDALNAIDKSQT